MNILIPPAGLMTLATSLPNEYESDRAIEAEPMLRSADFKFAYSEGGPITKKLIEAIKGNRVADYYIGKALLSGLTPKIDTKSVMLMPGMYPCIGGWHCDDVPRNEDTGQPDISQIVSHDHIHFLVHLASNENLDCPTEFLTSPFQGELDPNAVWQSLDAKLEDPRYIRTTQLFGHGEVAMFRRHSVHRGTPAKGKGWRYFFRLSFTSRKVTPTIRKQVQVYTDISAGW